MDRSKWEYKKLGDICDKGSSNIAQNKIEDNTGDYALYGASGYVKSIDFYHQDQPYIGVVKDGSGVGRANLYPAKSSLLGTMQYILPKKGCDLGYLLYVLQGLHLEKFKTGAAIPHIYFKDYGKCEVPFPPIADQQRIVAELDCLNEMIAVKQEQLKEFNKLAQSIFYDMFGDPSNNDKEWIKKDLKTICLKITDGTHDTPQRLNKGIKFITGKHIRPFYIDYDNSDYVTEEVHKEIYQRCNPEFGDVLYTNIGAGIGNAAINIVDYEFSMKNVALLKPNKEIINGYYIEFYLNNQKIKDRIIEIFANGGAQSFLSLKSISRIPIILPPLSLQQQFADKISAIEAQKELVKQSIAETQHLLDYTMDKYFG